MSQEALAGKCCVSRQSVSKWELDITLPETEKTLEISRIFGVTVDVLFSCGKFLSNVNEGIYEGILIKESIDN